MKNTRLDKATNIIAKIVQEQLASLPPKRARAMRKELHALAIKVSRRA